MRKSQLLQIVQQKLTIRNYSKQTIASYLSALGRFADWLITRSKTDVNNQVIEEYLFYIKNGKHRSRSALRQTIAALKIMYIHVLKQPVPEALDVRIRREKHHPTVLSEVEIIRLLNTPQNLKHRVVLMTLYSTGLRLSELLNLRVNDLDFDRNIITVKQGKGKKDRQTILAEGLKTILRSYLERYQPRDFLFEGQAGGRYSSSSVQAVMARAVRRAGIKKHATVHTLRHSFATHLVEHGTDIRFIQELLGHKRLETTQIYTQISRAALQKVKSPLDSIDIDSSA
ncbi:MAG: site-specific tyrosine recombinase/integron integrase [Candidatus Zixiibacteriota bacterium]